MVGCLLLIAFFGFYILLKCKSDKRFWLIFLIDAIFLSVLGCALEILSTDVNAALNATRVDYLGSPYICSLFLLFILDFCDVKVKARYIALLMTIPTMTLLLVWTAPYQTLYYAHYSFAIVDGLATLAIVPAAFYYVYHIYSYLTIGAASVFILYQYFYTKRLSRRQTIVLLGGSIMPLVLNVIYTFNFGVNHINYTPAAFVLTLSLFFITLVNFDMFNITARASEMAIDYMKESFILVDANHCFLNANAATFSIFPELKHISPNLSITGVSWWPKQLQDLRDAAYSNSKIEFSLDKDGNINYYSASVSEIKDSTQKPLGWVVLIQDISGMASLLGRLENMAFIDYLTGIFNRRYFMESAQTIMTKYPITGQKCAIIMFDLDHFKKVNDTYGHVAGDIVLKNVADSMRGLLRTYDLFARYGGEEFIVLVFAVNKETALKVAERIRKRVADTVSIYNEETIQITISLGVSIQSADSHLLPDVIEKADKALYNAKANGRNRVEFLQ